MSNNTTGSGSDAVALSVYGSVGYIVQGTIYGLSNALIGCSIAKYEALRSLNQYILLMTLAFGDAFNMLAYVAAGSYRLYVTFSGQLNDPLTPIECLLRPHVIVWMSLATLSSIMLAVISADRLFLVAFPETYLLSLPSPGYAKSIVASISLFTLVKYLVGVVAAVTKPQIRDVPPFCYVPTFLAHDSVASNLYVLYSEKVQASLAFVSVVIFVLVLPVHKYRMKEQDAALRAQDAASQRHMTKSLGISCACTLFLYIIPNQVAFWAWHSKQLWLARTMFLVAMLNCFANVWIYQLRHPEMKMALHGLLTGKTLPANLNVWKGNTVVAASFRHVSTKRTEKPKPNQNDMELESVH